MLYILDTNSIIKQPTIFKKVKILQMYLKRYHVTSLLDRVWLDGLKKATRISISMIFFSILSADTVWIIVTC
jgi:hypothetical protein